MSESPHPNKIRFRTLRSDILLFFLLSLSAKHEPGRRGAFLSLIFFGTERHATAAARSAETDYSSSARKETKKAEGALISLFETNVFDAARQPVRLQSVSNSDCCAHVSTNHSLVKAHRLDFKPHTHNTHTTHLVERATSRLPAFTQGSSSQRLEPRHSSTIPWQ